MACGRCSKTHTRCTACIPRCWSATSTSRHCRCCWRNSTGSAHCSARMRRGRPPMHDDAATLQAQQRAFAAHIRDPAHNAAPDDIEDRRLKIYRDLFFNSLESLLAGNFPVISATLGHDAWRELVRAFYAGHRCKTPLFTEIGKEFVDWLASGGHDVPPWLPELAHYEWVELALSIADAPMPDHDADGELLDDIPILSPVAWPLA